MTIPKWFNSEWYKRNNPDVGTHPYYGSSPETLYEHFDHQNGTKEIIRMLEHIHTMDHHQKHYTNTLIKLVYMKCLE